MAQATHPQLALYPARHPQAATGRTPLQRGDSPHPGNPAVKRQPAAGKGKTATTQRNPTTTQQRQTMKRYSHQQIEALLDKFMDGQTTVEEEAQLADYFRSADVPAEWEDYRAMFDYFDRGMTPPVATPRPRHAWWWTAGAAAAIAALIVGVTVLNRPASTTTTAPEAPVIASADSTSKQGTQLEPSVETQDFASLQTAPTQPVETQNLASRAAKRKKAHKDQRRLQAENAKLAQENERLQRELADLRRRAFIIDLEANGFRAVQDEDGSIVLIDLEQEIENELNNHLNNQPTTNIPAL